MLGLEDLDPIGQALTNTLPGGGARRGGPNDPSWLADRLCPQGIHLAVLPPLSKVPAADYRTRNQVAEDLAAGRVGKGWYLATDDVERIRKYVAKARKTHEGQEPNIGWHLGPSGLICVDCDNPGDVEFWQKLWVQREGGQAPLMNILSPGKLDNGVWMHRDGGYFVYRVPVGLKLTSAHELTKAEQAEAGREGWVAKAGFGVGTLLPPSVRAEGPYVYTDVPIIDAPDWLIDMCTPARPPAPRSRTDFDEEVDDVFEYNVDWDEVLEGIAKRQADDPCGCRVYRRYGGSPRSIVIHTGCEAVRGARCVTLHSDSIIGMFPALQTALMRDGRPTGRKSVSLWTFVAAVKFDGDLGAAARYAGLDLADRGITEIDAEEYGLAPATVYDADEAVALIKQTTPLPAAPPPVAMPPKSPDPLDTPPAVTVTPAPVPPPATGPATSMPDMTAGKPDTRAASGPPHAGTGFVSVEETPDPEDADRGVVAYPRPHYCLPDCWVCREPRVERLGTHTAAV